MLKPALAAPLSVRAPWLRGLFTWTAVGPLGLFLVVHLFINAAALRGDEAFARAVHWVARLPALGLIEVLFIFAPLLVHGGVGVYLAVARIPLGPSCPYPVPLRAIVRVTGMVAAAFIVMHLAEIRLRASGAREGAGELQTLLDGDLSAVWHGVPWRGAAYLLGTACVAFHFAAGLWGWFVGTAAGSGRHARRWAGWGLGVAGAAVWALLANIVVFHATGSRLFGTRAETAEVGGAAPCPDPANTP